MLAYAHDADAVPDVSEIHINPVILRKGYLNFMEETARGWVRRWVVSIICLMISQVRFQPSYERSKTH